jgi:hypothetical protein
MGIEPTFQGFVNSRSPYLPRPSSRLLPLDGRVHFLVHSWSNNCYLGFQSAVLVAIRAAWFQAVTKRKCTVTAEVASSSLVVPAILSKRVALISLQPTRVQKGAFLHPFCTPFRQLEPFSGGRPSGFDSVYASALGVVSEANTRASTAACAACFAGEIACV